jgi:hypothetical protein
MSTVDELAWFALGGYLVGAVLFVTVGPIADDIRDNERGFQQDNVPKWKRLAFAFVVRSVGFVFWPLFIPSALTMRRDRLNERRPGRGLAEIFELMSKLSADGVSEDAFPNGHDRFGYDLSNPIPAHTILGSKAYLEDLRTLDDRRVLSDRIGSFESEVCERPVDGYRLTVEGGSTLGTVYISPYQARTSRRAPEGLKLFGAAPTPSEVQSEADAPQAPANKTLTIDPGRLKRPIELPPASMRKPSTSSLYRQHESDEVSPSATQGRPPSRAPHRREREATEGLPDDPPAYVRPPRSERFEFADLRADTTRLGKRLYKLGQSRGRACVEAMHEALRGGNLSSAEPLAAARAIASRRGYLSVGLDKGMEGLIDGADPLFDQYRAAFIQGVENVIDNEP